MDKTINIPFEVWAITCVNCKVEFSVIGHADSGDFWPKQITKYCPYCGKDASQPNKSTGRKEPCDHEWIGLHGHPAAFECSKCKALRR